MSKCISRYGRPKRGCSRDQSRRAQAVGRSRGGLNTRIVALADAMGRLVKFVLQPGNAAEGVALPALVGGVAAQELIADKAYDTDIARNWLAGAGIRPVIPSRARRRQPAWYDPGVYGVRHLVENRFAAIKEYRGIATRYCKLAEMYAAILCLVATVVATREKETGRNPGGRPAVNRQLAI